MLMVLLHLRMVLLHLRNIFYKLLKRKTLPLHKDMGDFGIRIKIG